jgi:hypothetical protein
MFGEKISQQDDYNYLGLLLNYNGNFYKARKKTWLIKPNINIPLDLQLKLFDALVYPILTYSAEIWGLENKNIIEKIHLQFC